MAVASVLRPEPLFRLDDPEFFRQINDLTDRAKKCNWTVYFFLVATHGN